MIENGKVTWAPEEQAELDRVVEARLARERTKYSDYETLKQTTSDLMKYKIETEASLDTKIAQAVAAREIELKGTYESQISSIKAEQVTNTFLASKDVKLPDAYKKMIELSDDTAKLEESYKKVAEQFKADMKALGLDKEIGSPSNPGSTSVTKKFSEMTYGEKEELYKKDPDLYKKLRDTK